MHLPIDLLEMRVRMWGDLLGHADFKMTMRYAHLAQNDLMDAVSMLSAMP
jgi:site-specific recombinase XerD